MPFQPFGYRFDIASPLPPAELKAAIRAAKRPILDKKLGARGWIAGPFFCLWHNPYDRGGPMLFGRIIDEFPGARVRGRAGSDLNGLLMFTLIAPLAVYLLIGLPLARSWALIALLAFGVPWTYWYAHKRRVDAERLVRFIRKTAAPDGKARDSSGPVLGSDMVLLVNGEAHQTRVTSEAIQQALLDIGADEFVILERSPSGFIQAMLRSGGGYLLERRDGASRPLLRASGLASFEQVLRAFIAFAIEGPMPAELIWTPV